MKKRIAVFVFYDKDNIVDEYVYFLLKEIKKVVNCLIVVCNGNIADTDKRRMRVYAEKVIERENIGYDAGAIKDAILYYIGINELKKYEELLITNDTIYGPLYPLADVFEKMEEENVDFWGLTQTAKPRYLHSYFLVVREKMLHSIDFQKFWEQMEYYDYFADVLVFYEQEFTSFFEEKGYGWGSYIKTEKYKKCGYEDFPNLFYQSFDESLKDDNALPFLKRKPLANKKIFQSDHGGILFEKYISTIRSLAAQKYFDFNLVWNNLLRVYPLEDIQKGCNLTYVLETDKRQISRMEDVLFIINVETELFLMELTNKCNKFVKIVDVWVFTNNLLMQKLKSNLSSAVRLMDSDDNQYNSFWCYLIENSVKYQYICWLDTRDFIQNNLSYEERRSRYLCYIDNLSNSEGYITHVRNLLKYEDRLGLLLPPQIFEEQMLEEKKFNKQIKKCCRDLEILVPLSEKTSFLNNIHSFWVKKNLLIAFVNLLEDSSYRLSGFENDYMVEILAYYVQTRGYYTGIVKQKEYAVVDAAMKEEYLVEIIGLLRDISQKETYYEQIFMLKDKLLAAGKFIKKHSRVYIYGAGEIGKMLALLLHGIEGILVSDGQMKGERLFNMPVMYFSQYKWEAGDGIILALNPQNSKQVLKMFHEKQLEVDCFLYSL